MAETVFVVRRVNWRRTWAGWLRLPGETRLASFATAAEADAERRRMDDAARAVVNPFRCGTSLASRTGLDADRLHDWFLDAGVEPPADRDWAAWWDRHAAALPDAVRSRLWGGLDRLRFFEVIEEPAFPTVFVVLEVRWRVGEEGFGLRAEAEGGTPTEARRSRRRAEREAGEWHESSRRIWWERTPGPVWAAMDTAARSRNLADPFDPATPARDEDVPRVRGDAVRFFEVAEVPVVGGTGTRGRRSRLHVVTRLGWGEAGGRLERDPRDGGTSVMAFHDRAEARAFAADEDRRVRRHLSPFAFGRYGLVGEASALNEDDFLDAVRSSGLPPPPPGRYQTPDWRRWWDEAVAGRPPAEREAVWALCGRLTFHAVTAIDLED